MSNEEERDDRIQKEEKETDMGRVRLELNTIRDDLMYELDDLHDDLKEVIEDLEDEAEDIKDDLKDELEDLMEERESLLEEVGDIRGELEQYGEDARDQIEHSKEKLEKLKRKIERHEAKFTEKVLKKVEKAKKRINISVDPEMSEEWRGWAEGLGASVSELVRKSMKFVKNNIGDLKKLEQWGRNMEKMGEGIEKAVKDSGIEELGEKLEKEFGKKKGKGKAKVSIAVVQDTDKERIKKRVSGLIKLHKSLPIEKFAQALGKSNEDAENLVYEMVAEGIEGTLEEGVFKFTSTSEEVISKLNELIDKI
ncbi:MAG: hypothetical protein KAT57_03520 [Candidatus Lokiarchaeota archaeon]|nr:hypothetical protein [Candidatus Lokiarchaeota archaeon]